MPTKIFKIAIVFLFSLPTMAQHTSAYEQVSYVEHGDTLNYRVLYPKNFERDSVYPLVLFLHGAGERGNDNQSQLRNGGTLFLRDSIREKYPAIVIFPQCPKEDYWASVSVDRSNYPISLNFEYEKGPTKTMDLVLGLVEETLKNTYIKKDQVYLMGLSMGGMGTYELIFRKPDLFAAAIPICGAGDPKYAHTFAKKVPIWGFHGAQDNVVAPGQSIEMVSAILEQGGLPRFTLYEFANHNSWDPALNEPHLLPWLFSHKKSP